MHIVWSSSKPVRAKIIKAEMIFEKTSKENVQTGSMTKRHARQQQPKRGKVKQDGIRHALLKAAMFLTCLCV